ncbi:serine/arginine-rich splicing factor RS40-like isoform X2 [Amaranthus tricolor]|uniref:serine/arginine-rich splicing factor RS40-like isoform X2 n=1 Tax=Amaranthus tricolor TaxID=29722 RepID=UPI002590CB25|nr:serine/arginine-rich splicing factor RS40-like isoform X2 [Amaranthus tricolor]XP_057531780.1 serine/arginine-rich splicing factor RS40-like isoform X2 [Amaranthus tricolor]XP_057531781.1 serine/arginine-rich splicing factor RS40-like isoform X2 [Amaranthus tricolor]XP_057531782.1 serine/arginine-rich splicing factor RS40-like isoform X2 [Amaranthus tricolor]
MMTSRSVAGFAFVYMEDERDAEDAVRRLDRVEFGRKGRRLRVEWTKQEHDTRKAGGSRKPAANDRPSKTLFVINFDPLYTKSKDLERHFDPYGKITNIRIRRNFAFIQFETLQDATRALEATNMSKLMDRVITVEYAIRDDDRNNGHSPARRGRDRERERGRDLSPERESYQRRSPSPYHMERGSPDYGYRKERGSPDYGHGRKSDARGSADYGRDDSPTDGRYRSHSKPEGRRTPDLAMDKGPANGARYRRFVFLSTIANDSTELLGPISLGLNPPVSPLLSLIVMLLCCILTFNLVGHLFPMRDRGQYQDQDQDRGRGQGPKQADVVNLVV